MSDKVNKYRITGRVNHTLAPNENIVAYWARPSASSVLENTDINQNLLPRERVSINECNNTYCSMTGYVYEVFDDNNGNLLGWWPINPNIYPDYPLEVVKFEYTLLTRKDVSTGTTNVPNWANSVSVYPNPSKSENIISVSCKAENTLEVNLYNTQGVFIRQIYKGQAITGENLIRSTINDLTSGVYIYELKLDASTTHAKFIKQ